MLDMKEKNNSWKEILAATSFSHMGELKARWKEIDPANNDAKKDDGYDGSQKKGKEKGKGKNKGGDTGDWVEKQARIEQQKEEGRKKKAEREAAKRGETVAEVKVRDS